MDKPNFYSITPATVRYDKNLNDKAKLLYGEITALTSSEGYCWATNAYFAELYDVHESTITRLISQLVDRKYVRIELTKKGFKTVRKLYLTEVLKNEYVEVVKNEDSEVIENAKVEALKNEAQIITSLKPIINTSNTTKDKKNMSISADLEKEFEQLWKLYPKKEGKADARKHYIKARKAKTTFEEVENGLYRYVEYLNFTGTEARFIPMGSSWFCQAKWEDEYVINAPNQKATNVHDYLKKKYGSGENELRRDRKIINDDTGLLPFSAETIW
jgi:hypothetical protein